MLTSSNLGFPRIGPRRELKRALEARWSGAISEDELLRQTGQLRSQRWQVQRDAGIDHIPSNDFSLYDHVLDTALMVGAIPERFRWSGGPVDLDLMFAMGRGGNRAGREVLPLDMTKWFDTNYHYMVPELSPDQHFRLSWNKPVEEFSEALAQGIRTRPVLLGPITFLRLSKSSSDQQSTLSLLERLLPVYSEVLAQLRAAGAEWVQIDEPCLAEDVPVAVLEALDRAYAYLRRSAPGLKILVASYFAGLGPNLERALSLPVDGFHLDLSRAPEELDRALELVPDGMSLSLGLIDGRNVWRADPERVMPLVDRALAKLDPESLLIAPSCSLLHVPVSLEAESHLDPELRSWLAFAQEKLGELRLVAGAVDGNAQDAAELGRLRQLAESRRSSSRVINGAVRSRMEAFGPQDLHRSGDAPARRSAWRRSVSLPVLPTTTIGSFPQTNDLRQARAKLRRGELEQAAYEEQVEAEIVKVIRFQEEIGLDVLVHGEPERNDMVEYFAERLDGFLTTANGWVQSYGSRCVKPPIIFGDVSRPEAMTVRWASFAQGLTQRPVKGMLTGPVTILQWSFPRDDLERSESCAQIAAALRDEVSDLERAGIRVIQIDEPALREGLPLHRAAQPAYLRWSVDCFRLAAGSAGEQTQIHTHMCYSEFEDIMDAIAGLESDVLYIECARSGMELLEAFSGHGYPSEVGPGLYDIHSPLVPSTEEMVERMRAAVRALPAERLWANPDCGLKTRRWEEVGPSLRNLVSAAHQVAAELEPVSSSVH